MTSEELWQAVLGQLEVNLSKANFTTWFKDTFILEWKKEKIRIAVPSVFYKDYISKKYNEKIREALGRILDYPVREIVYVVTTQKRTSPNASFRVKEIKTPEERLAPTLNPRYTFSRFVVGKKNELAHAASLAVARKPGETYNPLFIYGGVGLGKTHLMQAVGHALYAKNAAKKILYATCETFTNEYITSVQKGTAHTFHEKYRAIDAMLIDDIQFLMGKEGTQEAFFHTFNHLQQNNKQVIITSDRPPKALPAITERLTSRFEGGMIADIGSPDLETRIAILKARCLEKSFSLSEEIVHFLATNIQNNVRELEGALNNLIASVELKPRELTLEEVKSVLRGVLLSPQRSGVNARQIIETVASYYSLRADDITSLSRKKELVAARQMAMFLMREEMRSSYPNIGAEFSNRDHTTAMYACERIHAGLENDEKLQQDLTHIRERIYNQNSL